MATKLNHRRILKKFRSEKHFCFYFISFIMNQDVTMCPILVKKG